MRRGDIPFHSEKKTVPIGGGPEQRRIAIVVSLIELATTLEQPLDHLKMAIASGKNQCRATVLVARGQRTTPTRKSIEKEKNEAPRGNGNAL